MIKRPHKKGWRCVAPLPQLDPEVPFVILPVDYHAHEDDNDDHEDDGDCDDDEYDAGNDANVNDISIAVAAYRHKW